MLLGIAHGPWVDWWSVGVLLYELTVGVPPFAAPTREAVFENVLARRLSYPTMHEHDLELSSTCRSLVDALLDTEYANRLGTKGGMREVQVRTEHSRVSRAPDIRRLYFFVLSPRHFESQYSPHRSPFVAGTPFL